ncbi:prepilin-type N-terminal cleavage/methylation domain-containing protein [Sutcliffiella horikoshii]|uniref:prepilin-type N-terminal cleavage/methylation domain-containing protein n=1 Tax=Sutcliffiella horikoshii TaxID=79883 RepID=UPI001F1BF59F|nr:prepilin-type N-terminal cleavage/methylation domain-containing protein [Sutcliffiella horikoshii]MCG1022199.1 prepilin-type N-terminal cleavage/methylation domain-containing protein [Sutcliffiella horikoshii]
MKNIVEERNDKGFTLLEVIVSIVILSIIILSFLTFFSQALFFSVKEERNLVGVNIAERILFNLEEYSKIDSSLLNISSGCDSPRIISNLLPDVEGFKKDSINQEKLLYDMNGKDYYSIITLCQDSKENDLSLHRIHIKVYQPLDNSVEGKLIYETFHYLNEI